MDSEFYHFQIKTLQGKSISTALFVDKVVLVVNTASKCGFTSQYEGLEALYQKYKDDGLVIIGFPCNQFNNQEPGDASQIQSGCLINYGVSFFMSEKVEVNGKNAHPLFQYLKSEAKGFLTDSIKWNFTKFLIDTEGKPIKRYGSFTKPSAIEKDILKLLKK
nr:glutathione peroxidase [uncultured Flavobacterium sp.]